MAYKFPRTATLSEFQIVNTDVKSSTYSKVAQYVVPAQQGIKFGKGAIINGVDTRGILKLEFQDANDNTIHGSVRLAYVDANEVEKHVVVEKRTEELAEGVRLGETEEGVKEDSKLIIEFKPDADATIDASKSSGLIPLTIYVGVKA